MLISEIYTATQNNLLTSCTWCGSPAGCQIQKSSTSITVWPIQLKPLTPTIQGGYWWSVIYSDCHTDSLEEERVTNCFFKMLLLSVQIPQPALRHHFSEFSAMQALNCKGTEWGHSPPQSPTLYVLIWDFEVAQGERAVLVDTSIKKNQPPLSHSSGPCASRVRSTLTTQRARFHRTNNHMGETFRKILFGARENWWEWLLHSTPTKWCVSSCSPLCTSTGTDIIIGQYLLAHLWICRTLGIFTGLANNAIKKTQSILIDYPALFQLFCKFHYLFLKASLL